MPIRDLHLCFHADPALQAARLIKNTTAKPTEAEIFRDLVTTRVTEVLEASGAGRFKCHSHGSLGFGDGGYTITSVFAVDDFDRAEALVRPLIDTPELKGKVDTYHWFETREETDAAAPSKSIEIYYDVDAIPLEFPDALEFRNAACELVEAALADAGAGEWSGADSGLGEVNFGFEVEDFDRAERIVRAAVAGTPFEGIRDITRFSWPEDLADK